MLVLNQIAQSSPLETFMLMQKSLTGISKSSLPCEGLSADAARGYVLDGCDCMLLLKTLP